MSDLEIVPCDRCPKCGRGTMQGPRYVGANAWSSWKEHLAYQCDMCGFTDKRDCADARAEEEL